MPSSHSASALLMPSLVCVCVWKDVCGCVSVSVCVLCGSEVCGSVKVCVEVCVEVRVWVEVCVGVMYVSVSVCMFSGHKCINPPIPLTHFIHSHL